MKSFITNFASTTIIGIAAFGAGAGRVYAVTPTWSTTETPAFVSNGAVSTGVALDTEPVSITVSLRLRNRAQLEDIAAAVASGAIPPITHQEFLSTYAPTAAQAQTVADYLSSQGYSNVTIDANNLLVSGDGTAGTAAAAFNTTLSHFTRNGNSGIGNLTDAQVPSTIANVDLAVLGLQTVDHPHTFIMQAQGGASSLNSAATPAGLHGYDPIAFPLVYSANTLPTGSAANVAIVSGL